MMFINFYSRYYLGSLLSSVPTDSCGENKGYRFLPFSIFGWAGTSKCLTSWVACLQLNPISPLSKPSGRELNALNLPLKFKKKKKYFYNYRERLKKKERGGKLVNTVASSNGVCLREWQGLQPPRHKSGKWKERVLELIFWTQHPNWFPQWLIINPVRYLHILDRTS